MQLSFFQPAPAVTLDTPTPLSPDVDRALVDALHMWYRHAVEIEPQLNGMEMPVTFPDGRRGRVSVWFTDL